MKLGNSTALAIVVAACFSLSAYVMGKGHSGATSMHVNQSGHLTGTATGKHKSEDEPDSAGTPLRLAKGQAQPAPVADSVVNSPENQRHAAPKFFRGCFVLARKDPGSTRARRSDNRCGVRANSKFEMLLVGFASLSLCALSFATTKGLSQIVTPDLQEEGDLSLSLQIQDKRIANPYELQAELGLTKWAEVAVFQGFKPNEEIFATELGILTREP